MHNDLLVKLYELPDLTPHLQKMNEAGISVRRALSPEKHVVVEWVRTHFYETWVSETDVAFGHSPVSCFIATQENEMLGFGCYDTTAKGFFGPTGVDEAARGKGIGAALLLVCLHALYADGYAYGIIGGAGPVEFYE
ncbi:MAG TPA: GNAT family N-acetyltransferase, partial [Aggregatilineales bacterium]|nr:GNAT family N-acetyltransferase [Aggregatilineales bacterium]